MVNSPFKDAGWEKYAEFKVWFDKRLDAAIKKVEEEEQTEEQEVHTECPKSYRKSVRHLLKYRFVVYLSRCRTDLR